MRRGRSGIGTELVPLVLILASLAGSLALVIAIHRRFVARSMAEKPSVAVVATPSATAPRVKPLDRPAPVAPTPEVDEPEPPPPPPPEDPTPKIVTKLVEAEAEQLLEASKADRKAAALEAAKQAAVAESERWRRRDALVRIQVDSLETKVHQLETHADELALERDALEKEIDARKALAAQAQSRPSTAILPHRGQNGTWRRPIVIECVNGTAVIRPQNVSFGLLELAMGFGPSSNPFVATVAREAIRIQGNASPDGQVVTPYIFFLIRPDGIRTYYEARGRLEPLGITFGYELADQDWEIDFPDLDDIKTWDGSGPAPPPRIDPLARLRGRQPGSSPAEDESFTDFGGSPGSGNLPGQADGPGNDFTWPARPKAAANGGGRVSLGSSGTGPGSGSGGLGNPGASGGDGPLAIPGEPNRPGGPGNTGRGYSATNGNGRGGNGGGGRIRFPGGTSGANSPDPSTGSGSRASDLPPQAAPRELALGGPISSLPPGNPGTPTSPATSGFDGSSPPPSSGPNGSDPGNLPPVVSPRTSPAIPPGSGGASGSTSASQATGGEPPSPYVLASPGLPPDQIGSTRPPSGAYRSPNQSPPVRHIGPFSRPLADGIDPASIGSSSPATSATAADETDPTQPDRTESSTAPAGSTTPSFARNSANPAASQKPGSNGATSRVIGSGDDSNSSPPAGSPPLAVGMGTPPGPPPSEIPPFGSPPMGAPPVTTPDTSSPPRTSRQPVPNPRNNDFKIFDERYEIVVVCNQRGVTVQPGAYRVTLDALKTREGLLKTEMVALVKAHRTANPKLKTQPRVRFLVQPGGEGTYWIARGQFLLSGLDWPISTQVAEPDRLSILPSEGW